MAVRFEDGGRYLVAANDDGCAAGVRLQCAVLRLARGALRRGLHGLTAPSRAASGRLCCVSLHGLLLAAGAGTRMGTPKALVRDDDGTSWLLRSVAVLRDGGCDAVTVVLGAEAERAARAAGPGPGPRGRRRRWAEGMGESLRAGLTARWPRTPPRSWSPWSTCRTSSADVVRRVAAAGADPDLLARAAYDGGPGHPVLLGRDHWAGVADAATGDRGRPRLPRHPRRVLVVECGDLRDGADGTRRLVQP